jgi:CBS domain-containing protein
LGPADALYIVTGGEILLSEPTGSETRLCAGDCFPIGALSGRRAPVNTFVAAAGSECFVLTAEDFHRLTGISAVFGEYCRNYLSSLVSQSHRDLQVRLAQQASDQQSLTSKLGSLVKREPLSVAQETPIGEALERMAAADVGSVVVTDADGRPIGIFTNSDLLRRVALPRIDLGRPIREVMSSQPTMLPMSATAYDAMLAMATHGIRHVLLVDSAGRLSGVISERDLFALQRIGLGQLRRAIAAAPDLGALRRAAAEVRQSAFNLLAQGVGAEPLTQFISALNDGIAVRIIELNLRRHDFFGVEWAWLAFGSEGREEQTFATDQDNGIVFVCPDLMDRDALQLRFLEFARDVNNDLDACGFPLCKGGVMASNPSWCLTLEQWQEQFSFWLLSPEPQALLNATIFFDFRALYGAAYLADRMYRHLFSLSRGNPAFQRMLAGQAISIPPPLGLFRDFVTEVGDDGGLFIDLKKFGSRLFVDAARVLALAQGIYSANTVKRLRSASGMSGGAVANEALVDAFNFIQLLRLRHQHLESGQGREGDNRIVPDTLNQLDRRILIEAFRQARRLQQRLKLNYQL